MADLQIPQPTSLESPLLVNAPENTEFYFAIGSMCNPVSLALRGLKPLGSWPAKLSGWQLEFRGAGGMGNVRQEEGASFHGVLHLMTHDDMIALDKIEGSYLRLPVPVELYDGRFIQSTVYKMDENRLLTPTNNPPGERYLDIIARGLKHFGVIDEYISWIQAHNCVPRKKLHECRVIPIARPLQPLKPCEDSAVLNDHLSWRGLLTAEQVAQCDGKEGRPLMAVLSGKVLEWQGPLDAAQYQYAMANHAGKDITVGMAKNLYEPRFPIPTTREALPMEHMALIEDMFFGWAFTGPTPFWKCVGIAPYWAERYNAILEAESAPPSTAEAVPSSSNI